MLGRIVSLLSLIGLNVSAHAQTDACESTEPACVLNAAWSAALILPEDKRMRLSSAFLEIALLSDDENLLSFWEGRFGRQAASDAPYPDYGWQKAEPILQQSGVEGLIERARNRQAPLSFGRTDALLSAGKRLYADQPDAALKLNEVLLELSQSASSFERPNLAHAATELAMARCDATLFSKAMILTDAPRNLRYAFWKARIDGSALDLLDRVRSIDNDADTRDVRRVLDGYRAILNLGYCDQSAKAIGG
jgi:hypothetical protein